MVVNLINLLYNDELLNPKFQEESGNIFIYLFVTIFRLNLTNVFCLKLLRPYIDLIFSIQIY
jgi:hypothetical protein